MRSKIENAANAVRQYRAAKFEVEKLIYKGDIYDAVAIGIENRTKSFTRLPDDDERALENHKQWQENNRKLAEARQQVEIAKSAAIEMLEGLTEDEKKTVKQEAMMLKF